MNVYLGVDWSATELECAVAVGDAKPRKIKGCKRSYAAVKDLVSRAKACHDGAAEVIAVIEAGSPGWVELLHHAGAVVHVVDAKQAKAFANSLSSSGAKDDPRDARNQVFLGRSPAHLPPAWQPDPDQAGALHDLCGLHETIAAELQGAEQRLRSHLRETMPVLEATMRDMGAAWVHRVLRLVPTASHAAAATAEAIEQALWKAGKKVKTKVREAIEATGNDWLGPSRLKARALKTEMLVEAVEVAKRRLEAASGELDQLTSQVDLRKRMESVGGIGQKMAIRLLDLVFIENTPETRVGASIQLGASPVFRGSGKDRQGNPKGHVVMRMAAAPAARATAYLLGRMASQQLAWAKQMYLDARRRGQSAGTAYRRIARSLLRILTAMARSGETYDDARYVAGLKAKGVAWALESPPPPPEGARIGEVSPNRSATTAAFQAGGRSPSAPQLQFRLSAGDVQDFLVPRGGPGGAGEESPGRRRSEA